MTRGMPLNKQSSGKAFWRGKHGKNGPIFPNITSNSNICSKLDELTFGTLDGIDVTIGLIQNLPREIRDMIYTFAYTQQEPIHLGLCKDSESRAQRCFCRNTGCSGWPEDTAGFLSSDIMGTKTAKEAAEIFYGSNTFHINGSRHIHGLGDHDHYNSGVHSIDHIRNIMVEICYSSPYYRNSDSDSDIGWHPRKKDKVIPNNEAYVYTQNQGELRH